MRKPYLCRSSNSRAEYWATPRRRIAGSGTFAPAASSRSFKILPAWLSGRGRVFTDAPLSRQPQARESRPVGVRQPLPCLNLGPQNDTCGVEVWLRPVQLEGNCRMVKVARLNFA